MNPHHPHHHQQQQQQQHPQQPQQAHPVTPEDDADRQVLELLQMMDTFSPIIPDALTDYLMTKAGVECDDIRLKRLVAMIAQKFVTDIANDAMHYNRQRLAQGGSGAAKIGGPPGSKKTTLTMEDLQAALADHGINIKRPSYFT